MHIPYWLLFIQVQLILLKTSSFIVSTMKSLKSPSIPILHSFLSNKFKCFYFYFRLTYKLFAYYVIEELIVNIIINISGNSIVTRQQSSDSILVPCSHKAYVVQYVKAVYKAQGWGDGCNKSNTHLSSRHQHQLWIRETPCGSLAFPQ